MSLPPSEIPQGAIRFNTDSQKLEFYAQGEWWVMSTDTPNLGTGADTTAGARGLFGGGATPGASTNQIEYINLASVGNSVDFGTLSYAQNDKMSCASSTRGIFTAAQSSPVYDNVIDYVTISSTGNAQDFADLSEKRLAGGGCGNQTRGLFMGGDPSVNPYNSDTIDYITIASQGVDAQDFGNLTVAKRQTAACSSPTRGICFGGYGPTNLIELVTISTRGDAQEFGDLTVSSYGGSGASNAVRGLYAAGGPAHRQNIDYITIASRGNSVRFGDLDSTGTTYTGGCSSSTRAVFVGGAYPASFGNVIEYVNIMTEGNAVKFGEYQHPINDPVGCSNAHGGL